LVTDTFCVLTSVMGDAQLFLQPQIVPNKEHRISFKQCFFTASARTSQR